MKLSGHRCGDDETTGVWSARADVTRKRIFGCGYLHGL